MPIEYIALLTFKFSVSPYTHNSNSLYQHSRKMCYFMHVWNRKSNKTARNIHGNKDNDFNVNLVTISGWFTNLGTQRTLAYYWIVSPSFLTSLPIRKWPRLCVGPSSQFFHTCHTSPTWPGGLCTAGITDKIFVTWYSITTRSSTHTATARMEPCLLTASHVRNLGWVNERVSPKFIN